MIYTILLLSAFLVFLLVRNYRNRYAWLLALMVIGLNFIFLGMILHVVKTGTYKYPDHDLFLLDYRMYLYLSTVRMNYYDTLRLLNIGTAIYLFCIPRFILVFFSATGSIPRWLWRWGRYVLLSLPPLFYVWYFDPDTRFFFYVKMNDPLVSQKLLSIQLTTMDVLHILWILGYLFVPLLMLIRHYHQTNLTLKKKQIVSLAINMGVLNVLFILVFLAAPFKQFYIHSHKESMLFLPRDSIVPSFFFQLMPIIMLMAILAMIFMMVKFKGIDTKNVLQKIFLKRNIRSLNSNMKGVFHSYKNTMFTIKILIEQAEAAYGTEDGMRVLQRMKQVSELSLQQTAKVLDSLKEIHVNPEPVELSECLESALKKAEVSPVIAVTKMIEPASVRAYIDRFHLTEALVNILNNASEAVHSAKRTEGKIDIIITEDHEWCVIKITDNGVGIDRAEQGKIFDPFYSTKSKHENWGVGLSYVFKVIEAHLGFITVQSERGHYTTFEILLPVVHSKGKRQVARRP
jgi:signal transduction histidine kinase